MGLDGRGTLPHGVRHASLSFRRRINGGSMGGIEIVASPAKRLSVIAACLPRGMPWPGEYLFPIKRWVELLLKRIPQSERVLSEIEILLVEDSPSLLATKHAKEVFRDELASGFLRLIQADRSGDPAALWNRGAEAATGGWLHFIRPPDLGWVAELPRLLDRLSRHDWIARLAPEKSAASHALLPDSNGDWGSAVLSGNLWESGTHVYRRSLFLECGRFPEGYRGIPRPKKLPGDSEFELAVRVALHLSKRGEKGRAYFEPARASDADALFGKPSKAFSGALEKMSLLRLFPSIPRERWLPWARGITRRK